MSVGLPGRPLKFTPDVQAQILELVGEGNYLDVACKAAGIAPRTLRHWRQQYRDGDPSVAEHEAFFAALEKAVALSEAVAIGRIRSGVMGWQGAAWFLERRYPKRWARRDPEAASSKDMKVTIEYLDQGPTAAAPPEPEEDP